tara:strand:- start:37 stop:1119 length:1083 start_codon:yes stop_codon:yes gene_type:complete
MKKRNTISKKKNKLTYTKKSRSPSINKLIDITSLTSRMPNNINICNSLFKIKLNINNKYLCLSYDNKHVINFLLNNLKSSKRMNPIHFIAPKQLLSNCWFNTMFVTFFFSDKGRKYFRFFRNLMITGKKYDNTYINDLKIRKLLFALNIFIEASYNQKQNALYYKINHLTYNLNTNFFIKEIYDNINKQKLNNSIPNIKEPGNPLIYYKTIMNYLNYNVLKIININLHSKINLLSLFNHYVEHNNIPDIIVIEDFESNNYFETNYNVKLNNNNYKYLLDSIIITNKDHFDANANSHFVSLATINKEEYKFDGSSYSKLSKFKWKSLINKNKDWMFKENPKYYPEKYNFTKGYKLMFYYRS